MLSPFWKNKLVKTLRFTKNCRDLNNEWECISQDQTKYINRVNIFDWSLNKKYVESCLSYSFGQATNLLFEQRRYSFSQLVEVHLMQWNNIQFRYKFIFGLLNQTEWSKNSWIITIIDNDYVLIISVSFRYRPQCSVKASYYLLSC